MDDSLTDDDLHFDKLKFYPLHGSFNDSGSFEFVGKYRFNSMHLDFDRFDFMMFYLRQGYRYVFKDGNSTKVLVLFEQENIEV